MRAILGSKMEAEEFVESFIREPASRRRILSALADAIECANQHGSALWATSIRHDSTASDDQHVVRLNVGKVQAFVLSARGERYGEEMAYVIIDPDALTSVQWATLHNFARQGKLEIGPAKRNSTLPSAKAIHFKLDLFPQIWPLIEEAHYKYIGQAARTVKERTNYYLHHHPGIIEYLRKELDRDVPEPIYG